MHPDAPARPAPRELNDRTIALHGRNARVPGYDRRRLRASVVHIGTGGFHRAHQAVYFDDLAERGVSTDWGVVGVGLRSASLTRVLPPQDCLYTLVERETGGDRARVIGAITGYIAGPADPDAVLSALSGPATKLVTLTVTGDGYKLDRCTGGLDLDDPDVAADLRHPQRPRTVPGFLVESLRRRRERGLDPPTFLSCDNLPSNGTALRGSVVDLARARDPELAAWIEENLRTPSTVVDRITPETSDEDRRFVAQRFGIRDRHPVVAESYSQWTIEDDFDGCRPPLEEVGARFVRSTAPHELAKKRLLNGGHCAIAYLGYLHGHRRTDEVLADPGLRAFLEGLMRDEIAPLLPPVADLELGEYRRALMRRLANRGIGDKLLRLGARGSTKMPAYLLPSLRDALERGRPHRRLTLAVAAWFHYLRGVDWEGNPIEVKDAMKDELQDLARRGGPDPRPLLSRREIFGDLGERESFVRELAAALRTLDRPTPTAPAGAEQVVGLAVAA